MDYIPRDIAPLSQKCSARFIENLQMPLIIDEVQWLMA